MLEQIRDICSECNTLQLIQNKTHWLCSECVFKRNHGGKSKQEVYKERHDKKEKKKQEIKPIEENIVEKLKQKFSIKKISTKRAERHKELKEVYKKIDNERDPICEGCGRSDLALSHSHILSEYIRPDLYTDENNIRLHCFGNYHACHETIERGLPYQVVKMDDWEENLEYIKEKDIKEYNKIVASFEFYGVKL